MSKIIKFHTCVYVVLGIDEYAHDQILSIFNSYTDAKKYCMQSISDAQFFDLWIEKHTVL